MALVPVLEDDEVFIPEGEGVGRIVQLHELQIDGKTLTGVSQVQAFREAQKLGWKPVSLAGDWRAYFYAKQHQEEDPKVRKYYESVASGIDYARYSRTQVHDLRSAVPFVVNINRVHPEFNLSFYDEGEIIAVKDLPKYNGFIQELDERTGLPTEVGPKSNPNFDGAYYYVEYALREKKDVVAAIRDRDGSRPNLNLIREPGYVSDGLGVRVEKNFPPLEEKL